MATNNLQSIKEELNKLKTKFLEYNETDNVINILYLSIFFITEKLNNSNTLRTILREASDKIDKIKTFEIRLRTRNLFKKLDDDRVNNIKYTPKIILKRLESIREILNLYKPAQPATPAPSATTTITSPSVASRTVGIAPISEVGPRLGATTTITASSGGTPATSPPGTPAVSPSSTTQTGTPSSSPQTQPSATPVATTTAPTAPVATTTTTAPPTVPVQLTEEQKRSATAPRINIKVKQAEKLVGGQKEGALTVQQLKEELEKVIESIRQKIPETATQLDIDKECDIIIKKLTSEGVNKSQILRDYINKLETQFNNEFRKYDTFDKQIKSKRFSGSSQTEILGKRKISKDNIVKICNCLTELIKYKNELQLNANKQKITGLQKNVCGKSLSIRLDKGHIDVGDIEINKKGVNFRYVLWRANKSFLKKKKNQDAIRVLNEEVLAAFKGSLCKKISYIAASGICYQFLEDLKKPQPEQTAGSKIDTTEINRPPNWDFKKLLKVEEVLNGRGSIYFLVDTERKLFRYMLFDVISGRLIQPNKFKNGVIVIGENKITDDWYPMKIPILDSKGFTAYLKRVASNIASGRQVDLFKINDPKLISPYIRDCIVSYQNYAMKDSNIEKTISKMFSKLLGTSETYINIKTKAGTLYELGQEYEAQQQPAQQTAPVQPTVQQPKALVQSGGQQKYDNKEFLLPIISFSDLATIFLSSNSFIKSTTAIKGFKSRKIKLESESEDGERVEEEQESQPEQQIIPTPLTLSQVLTLLRIPRPSAPEQLPAQPQGPGALERVQGAIQALRDLISTPRPNQPEIQRAMDAVVLPVGGVGVIGGEIGGTLLNRAFRIVRNTITKYQAGKINREQATANVDEAEELVEQAEEQRREMIRILLRIPRPTTEEAEERQIMETLERVQGGIRAFENLASLGRPAI